MGIAEDLDRFEQGLKELIIKYEQYFIGLEKREPLRLLDEIERLSRRHVGVASGNTMLKFRYSSLVARLASYRQYWSRINKLIEEGRYSRDRFRMELHAKGELSGRADRQPEANPEVELVYQQYLEARRSCNLPVNSVSREMIAAAIERQKPAIIDRYGCKSVEFRVVIEEGAPKIKAKPVR